MNETGQLEIRAERHTTSGAARLGRRDGTGRPVVRRRRIGDHPHARRSQFIAGRKPGASGVADPRLPARRRHLRPGIVSHLRRPLGSNRNDRFVNSLTR